MASEQVDVVIIGAGMRGIITAKTYIQVQPDVNLVMLEAMSTPGGTWAEQRLYPGLKTHTTLGSYECSDLPMTEEFGVKPAGHIPGQVVHDYLKQYIDKFDLGRRIRCNTTVKTVERLNDSDQWRVSTNGGSTIVCDKLIIATGLMSEPFIPAIPGMDAFGVPIVHTRDLREHAERLLRSASLVTVYGGRKSAQDAVHYFASNGVKVHWCIRESGHGPGWLASTKPVIPSLALDRIPFIRMVTALSPCIWGDADGQSWLRGFFHGTRLGRWITQKFWASLTDTVVHQNGYDSHPKLQKLKPRCGVFWSGSSPGGLNFSTDFFALVKSDVVDIHVADITELSNNTIHLSTGESISTDALICCTGWRSTPSFPFLPERMERELGMPYRSNKFDDLTNKATQEILSRFPIFANQPSTTRNPDVARAEVSTRPFRLYRFIAPPTDAFRRSIAFIGMLGSPAASEVEALWCVAYLNGRLTLDAKTAEERERLGVSFAEERMWETTLASEYCRLRAPAGYGNMWPDLTFDVLPYYDLLLRDLRLDSRRKGGFLKELFTPYGAQDYRGIVEEWLFEANTNDVCTLGKYDNEILIAT
ncbi:hypothetical protein FRB95_006544 [Tulasnella sp. JGI-2019a]|nr:hypothetical protein FRB95_006544 [Tulasnella sp. JGI-2019a]